MLAQLWRVSVKLKKRFPKDVDAELAKGGSWASRSGFGDVFTAVLSDPFGWLDANRSRLAVDDLGDGTAAFSVDFIVWVPKDIGLDINEIIAVVTGYKLLSKTFKIQRF